MSGCGSAATPNSLPPPARESSAPQQTAEPNPIEGLTLQPTPTDSDGTSEEAAMSAFADLYLETANAALADEAAMAEWRAHFVDSCTVCLSGYETTEAIYASGRTIIGGQLSDWSIEVEEASHRGGTVLVAGSIEPATVTTDDGSVVEEFDGVPSLTIIYSVRLNEGGDWIMVGGQLVR
jgi:hypothetical protein